MIRHKTVVVSAVQLESSNEVGVSVLLNVPCEEHGGHKMNDDWRVECLPGDGNDFDWLRDVLVSIIERY